MVIKTYPSGITISFKENNNKITMLDNSALVVLKNNKYLRINIPYRFHKVFRGVLCKVPNVMYSMSYCYIPISEVIIKG